MATMQKRQISNAAIPLKVRTVGPGSWGIDSAGSGVGDGVDIGNDPGAADAWFYHLFGDADDSVANPARSTFVSRTRRSAEAAKTYLFLPWPLLERRGVRG